MDGHRRIAQHGFGTRGGNRDKLRFAGQGIDHRVLQMPEMALDGFLENFIVTHRRLEEGIPVDQSLPSIDPLLCEQIKERLPDCGRAALVERESSSLPVAAAAHPFELSEDPGFILVFPSPNSIDQLFASQVMTRFAFLLLQPAFHNGLGGDTRVISAGHPEGVVALHAF